MESTIFIKSIITPALIDDQKNLMLSYIAQRKEYKRQKLYLSKLRTGWIKPKV